MEPEQKNIIFGSGLSASDNAGKPEEYQYEGRNSESESEEEESDSSGDRWDPAILSDMDCVNVFVDQGDVEDNLPEFFDVNMVNKYKHKNCYLCQTEFGKISKKRILCKMCG